MYQHSQNSMTWLSLGQSTTFSGSRSSWLDKAGRDTRKCLLVWFISYVILLVFGIYNKLRMPGTNLNPGLLSTNMSWVKTATSTTVKSSKEMKRERNRPDSIVKSLNFTSWWVRRNFINHARRCFWKILNYLGLLVNSAYATASFNTVPSPPQLHYFLHPWLWRLLLQLPSLVHNHRVLSVSILHAAGSLLYIDAYVLTTPSTSNPHFQFKGLSIRCCFFKIHVSDICT